VGDYIETVGVSGTVEQIGIFYTTVVTPDNKTAHIPNGSITNSNIMNYNQKELRRLDLEYTISYEADFKLAQKIIYDIIVSNDKVLKDNDIVVRMGRQDSSSIVIFVKVWTHSDNYHTLNYDLNEAVKSKFDEYNIEIPFDQLDIHLKGEEHESRIAKRQ
jgi:small conductance mechanosensitive channel